MSIYSFNTDKVTRLFFVAAVLLIPRASFSQGFSGPMGIGQAKTVTIKQLLPATVNLVQKRINIKATAAIKTNEELVTILETKLLTFIQKDPRFIVDPKNPQTLLKFTVTNSYIEERHYTVGTGNQTQNCTGFTGKLEVSYQALDTSNQAPLDSENLVAAIVENDHKNGGRIPSIWPPSLSGARGACGTQAKSTMHEAQDELVDGIVHQMAQRAAPTEEAIVMKLPGRKLEALSRLASAGRWADLEEQAQKAEKLPKPDEDAYRIYLVAMAKEAQAYDLAREAAERDNGHRQDISQAQADENFKNAMNLIDEARKNYKDALQAKSNEKEFQEPDNRMERAVSVYAKIARDKEEYKKALLKTDEKPIVVAKDNRPGDQTAKTISNPGSSTNAGSTSPLDQILTYCQQNMAVETITEYINDPSFLADAKASGYKFNFKTDPLALNASCKGHAAVIQRQMRDRLNGTATPHRTGVATK